MPKKKKKREDIIQNIRAAALPYMDRWLPLPLPIPTSARWLNRLSHPFQLISLTVCIYLFSRRVDATIVWPPHSTTIFFTQNHTKLKIYKEISSELTRNLQFVHMYANMCGL